MKRKLIWTALAAVAIGVVAVGSYLYWKNNSESQTASLIRYGISPFQDTAMPVLGEAFGLYQKEGLNIRLVTVPWEDIVPALASRGRTVDVAIGSVNTFLPRAENINVIGGGDVIFYSPFYVFKGASLIARSGSGIKPLAEFLKQYPNDRQRAIKEAMAQLRGRPIAVPKGTPYEQMLRALAKEAGMNPDTDMQLHYVQLADALPGLLAGSLDVIGAGVTQRTEAERTGNRPFVTMEEIGFAEIIGLMTTRHFLDQHRAELDKLITVWFESVDLLFADVDKNAQPVLQYLDQNASTKYSLEEYKRALTFQEFPRTKEEAQHLFNSPNSRFYWKRTWDIVNDYLLETNAITKPIPYNYYIETQ